MPASGDSFLEGFMEIKTINPGNMRSQIKFLDDIVYSEASGKKLTLSVMRQTGKMKVLSVGHYQEVVDKAFPTVLWFNGARWTGVDKNQMLPELSFLVDAGYAVVCVYYRSVHEGKFPDQVIDCKTAVRFIRANAEKYHIDPERIAVMGRSAGGYLASFLAMNTDCFEGTEWPGQSSKVQACVDMFGPVDLRATIETDKGNPRLKSLLDGPAGTLLGGDEQTLEERAVKASVTSYVNKGMCPIMIAHGDADQVVPYEQSVRFAEQVAEVCGDERFEAYLLKDANHGDDPFYQDTFKRLIVEFLRKHL